MSLLGTGPGDEFRSVVGGLGSVGADLPWTEAGYVPTPMTIQTGVSETRVNGVCLSADRWHERDRLSRSNWEYKPDTIIFCTPSSTAFRFSDVGSVLPMARCERNADAQHHAEKINISKFIYIAVQPLRDGIDPIREEQPASPISPLGSSLDDFRADGSRSAQRCIAYVTRSCAALRWRRGPRSKSFPKTSIYDAACAGI